MSDLPTVDQFNILDLLTVGSRPRTRLANFRGWHNALNACLRRGWVEDVGGGRMRLTTDGVRAIERFVLAFPGAKGGTKR